MASVEKMLIKGIRSFSPDNQHVIEFQKPLTLIVGQNGAGKTTIIECLRMACSGSLPPNTRSGQSFIHDPKVANDTEVKGQIRLRIRGNNQQPVVIVRSFQLTQKKSTLQFKALDQVLQTINRETGEKQALTYKCADIDRIIPTIMGVSKAIIENVIFVHQEDANWPLAEPKILKERFDDVFAATKYTKALEAIRKLRLEKVQEVRELKLKLDHLKTHKEMATHLSSEISDSQAKSQQMESQMKEVQSQIDVQQQQAEPLKVKLRDLDNLGTRIAELETQRKTMSKHNSDMFAKLKEGDYEEDTEELEKWVRQFDERVNSKGLELRKIEREIQNTHMNTAALKEQYTRMCHRQGKLQAEADVHKENISERNSLLQSLAEELKISGVHPDNSATDSDAHIKIGRNIQEMEDALVKFKAESRAKDEKVSEALECLNTKMAGITESLRIKHKDISHNTEQQEAIQNRMKEFVGSDKMLDDLRCQETDALAKLNANKMEQDTRNLGNLLERASDHICQTQRKIAVLRQERDKVFAATEAQTQYRIKHKELLTKEKQAKELFGVHQMTLRSTLGQDVSIDKLLEKADAIYNQLKSDMQLKTQELSIVQNKASILKGSVESARHQLESYKHALDESRKALKEGLRTALGEQVSEVDYQGRLTQHEKDSSKMMEKMSQVKASIKVMSAYVSLAGEESACPLCKRSFTEEEKDSFIQDTSEEIKQLPEQISKMEGHLMELQQRLGGLKHLQPMWIRFSDLRDKQIPKQKEAVSLAETRLCALENEAEDLESLCALAKHDVDTVQKLLEQVIRPIDSMYNEVCCIRKEVNSLEAKGEEPTIQKDPSDIDRELAELESSKASYESEKDELVKDQNRLRDELLVLSTTYRDTKDAVERQLNNIRQSEELQNQANRLGKQTHDLRQQLQLLTTELENCQPKRQALLEERSKLRSESQDAETRQENKVRLLRATNDKLQLKVNLIQEYEGAKKAETLADVTQQLGDQDKRMMTLHDKIEQLERQRKIVEDEIRNQEELKRTINDCLDWRHGKQEIERLSEVVKDLLEKKQEIGDQKDITDELEKNARGIEDLRSKFDMMKGGLNTLKQRISKAEKDLSTQQYKDVQARYARVDLEVTNMSKANLDLDKYHRALEKALLTFHTTKMSDINKIVRELWQKTYRGHDIDYVQIRTDTEGVGKASYNYRLVMVVGGTELEMRGRCSTGQKVLACIIVRLALAETFCLNCGILSLDEPTTNLDEANARSLAEALRTIIEARRQQENFQLIIITHDENFAQMLGSREHSEKLWKVTKDESHYSMITLEDMP